MDTCESGADRRVYVGIRYRDGLIIALLIACPMRLKNLVNLLIGQHLVFEGQEYRLKLSAAETKTGRPYHAAVPPSCPLTSTITSRCTDRHCNQLHWRVAAALVGDFGSAGSANP